MSHKQQEMFRAMYEERINQHGHSSQPQKADFAFISSGPWLRTFWRPHLTRWLHLPGSRIWDPPQLAESKDTFKSISHLSSRTEHDDIHCFHLTRFIFKSYSTGLIQRAQYISNLLCGNATVEYPLHGKVIILPYNRCSIMDFNDNKKNLPHKFKRAQILNVSVVSTTAGTVLGYPGLPDSSSLSTVLYWWLMSNANLTELIRVKGVV